MLLPNALRLKDGVELTLLEADAALCAFFLVNHMWLLNDSGNSLNRAAALTNAATYALSGVDFKSIETFTYAGGTTLVNDMGEVFIAEISHGGQDRIWRRLAKRAEGS
jgi:hypothetical protein